MSALSHASIQTLGPTLIDTLSHTPGFGLALTLAAYLAASQLHHRLGRPALLSPVLVTMIAVSVVLDVLGISYQEYLSSVSILALLLGPATVALALPLLHSAPALLSDRLAVAVTLLLTGAVSLAITVAALTAFGADDALVLTTLPRSVTTPVALTLGESIGANTTLAVVLTLISGILGATIGPWLLDRAHVSDPRARGFALGVTSHGIGTSRALTESTVTGGWSSAAMVLNALTMTVALPLLARAFH
ncbi:LrgB family protein [Kineococcus radiotolerans]|uniref:LrgB family protein n=1 Tax=Kineococcus radiotolerans (strain ATCC BAA-149 / DSM 14245 / SRS30216) TaxID=266940 RepID=A6WA77_KINRD|nr:LrgB family protein [Kineococcus radiotolerans]ABS03716.1 LrgB family protein [Kineococcus radiotolerans SRS30216 = ATCC BAA-149]